MPNAILDTDSIQRIYEDRYQGDYMAGDCFTRWSHSGVELSRVRDTLGRIPAEGVRSVLDYGCGQGAWMEQISRMFPGASVQGIDISETAVRKARERAPGHEFHRFDGVRAPFDEASFDLVFSCHVLEHVLDIEKVVADMTRLVRPGGFLCIIFPCGNPGSFEAGLVTMIEGGLEKSSIGSPRFYYEDPTHLRRMQSAEIIDLFRKHGVGIRAELYAHQFMGAIEWISKSGRAFVRGLFDVRRGVDRRARARLAMTGLLLQAMALLMEVSAADLSRSRAAWKTWVLYMLFPIRLLGRVVAAGLELLARIEWRYFRMKPNGSAQFLVFQR